jgi:hypothetical protein
MFKVSRSFIGDFAQVANHFGWVAAEIDEFKSIIRAEGNGEMMRYISKMAYALRNGYRQTEKNKFIRLDQWLWNRGESLQ